MVRHLYQFSQQSHLSRWLDIYTNFPNRVIYRAHRRFIGLNMHQPKLPPNIILRCAQDLTASLMRHPNITLVVSI